MPEGSNIASTAQIHPSAKIGNNVTIGHHVVIHAGTIIHDRVTIWDGSVIGRAPQRPGKTPSDQIRSTEILEDAVIGSNTTIYAGTKIGFLALIGDGVRIRENCVIGTNCIVGSNCTFQNEVTMARDSRVIDLSHITAGVFIGEGAFVSTGVLTMNDDSFNGNNAEGDRNLEPPVIGRFASIGGGAILLPGVKVGERAVVAAGSTVTKNVAPGTVVMGVAAKRRYLPPVDEGLHALVTTGYRPHDGDNLIETPRAHHYGADA